jgi:hypothetical protein
MVPSDVRWLGQLLTVAWDVLLHCLANEVPDQGQLWSCKQQAPLCASTFLLDYMNIKTIQTVPVINASANRSTAHFTWEVSFLPTSLIPITIPKWSIVTELLFELQKHTHSNSRYRTDFKSAWTGLELEFKKYINLPLSMLEYTAHFVMPMHGTLGSNTTSPTLVMALNYSKLDFNFKICVTNSGYTTTNGLRNPR